MEYLIVRNIPPAWRSYQLRNFFYHSVEKKHFETFHYKHRKRAKKILYFFYIFRELFLQLIYGPRRKELLKSDTGESAEECCCLIKVDKSSISDFVAFYSNRNWVCPVGKTLRQKCIIYRVKITENILKNNLNSAKERRAECRNRTNVEFSKSDIVDLPELNPPRRVFPRGNVGTADDEFRHLISKCRIPTSVLKSLKLNVSKKSTRRYQKLPHKYNDNIFIPPKCRQTIETKNGHDISYSDDFENYEIGETENEPEIETNEIVISSDDEMDDFGMEGTVGNCLLLTCFFSKNSIFFSNFRSLNKISNFRSFTKSSNS